jgi:hypothetical protein
MTGGFYHDGRFATLMEVIEHYDGFFHLGLSGNEKNDVAEYLKSLGDDVPANARQAHSLNAGADAENTSGEAPPQTGGVSVWPLPAPSGTRVEISFLSPSHLTNQVPADLTVGIYDLAGRRVSQMAAGATPAEHGMVNVAWNGRQADGGAVAAGVYFVRATAPSVSFHTERRIVVR